MKNLKSNKMLLGIGIAFILLATISISYAWFSATVKSENVKDQIVTTGTLELTYIDGPEIKIEKARPGQTVEKTVSVKNTGTLDAEYNLVWQELINQIQNDEMVMTIACERQTADGAKQENCEGLENETPISKPVILKQIGIEAGITHKYTITITFKETNSDQNYNQGKNFTGTIGVNEYKEPTPVYCTTDQELTQGTEFVKGPYTYVYKQRYYWSETGINSTLWEMDEDGWTVMLTDKESTDPVTDTPCTYINNLPVLSTSFMFDGSNASLIDLSNFNTSKIIYMNGMFHNSKATEIKGLENFNTSNVTDMSMMFNSSEVQNLVLSSFDTSNVTNMDSMFGGCKTQNLDVSSFDTNKVTDMSWMFGGTKNLKSLDVRNFNTSNVTDMYGIFGSSALSEIKGYEKFDTSKVTNMARMFYDNMLDSVDVSRYNTTNVVTMNEMFAYSNFTTLDLSSFDTSNLTNMYQMFRNCKNLKTIYVSNTFVTNKVDSYIYVGGNVFLDSTNLVGGAGTTYDSSKINKTYARIDGGTAKPGYFTLKTN